MSGDAKVRVVAFVSSTIAEQYAALSRRFGVSRSELVRMALQRGYRSIASWCEKHRAEFEVGSGGLAGSGSDRKEASASSPIAMLSDYCRVLVDQEPDLGIDQVRVMATASRLPFSASRLSGWMRWLRRHLSSFFRLSWEISVTVLDR